MCHTIIARKGKILLIAALILIIIVVFLRIFIFGTFSGIDVDASEVSYVELSVEGDFDTARVGNPEDISNLISSINGCESEGASISTEKGGYNIYRVTFYLKDGSLEDLAFINRGYDAKNETYHMNKLTSDNDGFSLVGEHFKGNLIKEFYELVKEYNPTENNMEWYDAVMSDYTGK
ncbi:MAG TPA: hypothetical protein IAB13_00820 [Candidatus Avanaerovorax faecigallinarum]|nr:hypothetical protein [Candidatus Avanaerovorax faecigallinarum]